ncbi:MAG: prolipoprotein diacylglyceryl transferase [Bacteroidetes bacterium]|nr:prolipoprotein diacylglyceryl transferase [Bacteroidota bacterium]
MKFILLAINWNVHPEIFPHNDSIELRWYGFFFFLLLIFGYFYIRRCLKKDNKPLFMADEIFICLALSLFIGARLAYVFIDKWEYFQSHLIEIPMFWKGGLTGHGAYLFVVLTAVIYTHFRKGISFGWLADRLVVPVCLAGFLIRLGNFFNHEIVGIPNSGLIGVNFKYYTADPVTITRLPIQLIEGMGYLVILVILLFTIPSKYKQKEGMLMGYALIFIFCWRLMVDSFKEGIVYQSFIGIQLPMSYWLSFPFIMIGILMVATRSGRKPQIK